MAIGWGREICGELDAAERREWLCTNGVGGFASGTVAGTLTRRYHGLLVAALSPPLGRTLVVAKLDESAEYDGDVRALSANRWAGGAVDPHGYREIEAFRLDGTAPVWAYTVADAQIEKRLWMEPGANTTYVRYQVLRGRQPARLTLKALVNYRDYHGTTRGDGWTMAVAAVEHGVRVVAYDGARPFTLTMPGAEVQVEPVWYHGFDLPRERDRGLDATEDHLHAATFSLSIAPGAAATIVLSAEADAGLDGEVAWQRRVRHEDDVLSAWRAAQPTAARAPDWIRQLVLAADQFIVRRRTADDPDGMTVIAGYHWFGDWGRDTMISLPGLTLTTGRPEIARRVLGTFARHVDRGMLPNRFPDAGDAPEQRADAPERRADPPEYNTVDATLWYFEAVRAYHQATGDDGLLKELYPILESIVAWHRDGTRYGIHVDPADGLLAAGEPGLQLTWMDARVGGRVITPRTGKPVEINALWYNALVAMAGFAKRLGQPVTPWTALAGRVRESFGRFWNDRAGYCHDVIDTPSGDDDTLRPNQIFAVALTASPLDGDRRRAVVDTCARHLLTSYGLRSLAPGHPDYRGHYAGDAATRDAGYHQGPAWGWLLGPFALAHFKVHGDAALARSFLRPLEHHLADGGLGSIAEIFDGDAPHTPGGCIAQAWSVAETLRAWHELEGDQ